MCLFDRILRDCVFSRGKYKTFPRKHHPMPHFFARTLTDFCFFNSSENKKRLIAAGRQAFLSLYNQRSKGDYPRKDISTPAATAEPMTPEMLLDMQ